MHILEEYVPKKLTEEEVAAAVKTAISETGVSEKKDKGKLIGVLKAKYGETIDIKLAIPVIDSILK